MVEIKKRIEALSDDEIRESLLLGKSGFQEGVFSLYQEEARNRNLDVEPKFSEKKEKTGLSFLAPRWKRAFNYMIDVGLFFYLPLRLFFYEPLRNALFSPVFALLILLGVILSYYIICERLLGKTLGKLVTRTTVLSSDSEKPGLGEIIKRTFSRLIPFNWLVIAGTGKGIHDRLSKTICIEDKKINAFRVESNKQIMEGEKKYEQL